MQSLDCYWITAVLIINQIMFLWLCLILTHTSVVVRLLNFEEVRLRDVMSVSWRAGVFMPCVFKLWRAVRLMKSVMSYIWGETVAWRVFGLLTLILTVLYFSSQFCCRDVFRAAVMSDFNFIKALIASYDINWRAYHSL